MVYDQRGRQTDGYVNFYILDEDALRRFVYGSDFDDVELAAGVQKPFSPNQNDLVAEFTASGSSEYTVVPFSQSPLTVTYVLQVAGGVLVDRYGQTNEAAAARAEFQALSAAADNAAAVAAASVATATTPVSATVPVSATRPAAITPRFQRQASSLPCRVGRPLPWSAQAGQPPTRWAFPRRRLPTASRAASPALTQYTGEALRPLMPTNTGASCRPFSRRRGGADNGLQPTPAARPGRNR